MANGKMMRSNANKLNLGWENDTSRAQEKAEWKSEVAERVAQLADERDRWYLVAAKYLKRLDNGHTCEWCGQTTVDRTQ